MKSVVVFMGPPGCGKGTQAAIMQKNGAYVICAGDILRKNREKEINGTTIGAIIDGGKLLPDGVIGNLIKEELSHHDAGCIVLDGFPRTVGQAKMLDNMLQECKMHVDFVINFRIDDAVLIDRIVERFACKQCGAIYNAKFNKPKTEGVCDVCGCTEFVKRNDDSADTLKMRLREYHDKTSALLEYYADHDAMHEIDANLPVTQIQHTIESIVRKTCV